MTEMQVQMLWASKQRIYECFTTILALVHDPHEVTGTLWDLGCFKMNLCMTELQRKMLWVKKTSDEDAVTCTCC